MEQDKNQQNQIQQNFDAKQRFNWSQKKSIESLAEKKVQAELDTEKAQEDADVEADFRAKYPEDYEKL